ncbi:elongator complex protein 2 isoform X2 [Notolabrus celidotus]|uniref:elongator complex protein 2 isoform X2 n=2 Tax=Notolabrus celidotus TaxID=1203425 RepID=UPI00148FFF08|nr:elongator complex protein 2 isoform X2 [Notolabrus celidotus]
MNNHTVKHQRLRHIYSNATTSVSKMAAPVMETCHIACSTNRTPKVVSWSRGGILAFGTCNSVALYDPQERKIVDLLNGHTSRVNAVKWIHREDCAPESHLVSGASDNQIIVWEAQNGKFIQTVQCKGHTSPVCAVDGIYVEDSKILVASSASDSTVRLWLCNRAKEAECLHTLSFGSCFMMDVSLALLPGSRVPILACGGDDSRVHLYVQSSGQLQKAMQLQGHEDWVRGVAWASLGGELLLASCSQDCLIRVWRLCAKSGTDAHAGDDHTIIKMKEDVFEVKDKDVSSVFAVALETVLAGHENWVYGVHWQPPFYKGGKLQQPLSLLSASMDKTMILWAPEEGSGVWVEQVRVGEVGGNTLGFYGCQMSPDGSMIVAHAFHGALHLWCKDQDEEGEWRPGVVISGHFNEVQDLSWDPEGEFILSVGSDQTTRLFTPWKKQDSKQATWHEITRPQIHGYDMQCLAMVGRFQFVSGADEKVLRVFQAPRNFVENFANISGTSKEKLLTSSDSDNLPEGASTPALGLSNKAVFQGDLTPKNTGEKDQFSSVSDQYQESYFHPLIMTEPPPEDHLLQNTLWPEVQKLYGHGFEMFCLASDSTRTVVASACKASKAEHAAILLWSTATWRQLQSLSCHSLTVTQMAFSPDARLLLAVSRDRTWSLWRRDLPTLGGPEPQFSLHTHTGKDTAVHTRIIWSCDWSPDSKYFVTSSRDKKVIVWGPCRLDDPGDSVPPPEIKPTSSILDVGDSATAVAFCPVLCSDNRYLLAVGLESGRILLYRWSPGQEPAGGHDWSRCGETDFSQSHSLAVKRLRWRPRTGLVGLENNRKDRQTEGESETEEESSWVQLASASADHSVKIFNINRRAL